MKAATILHGFSKSKQLAYTAAFAALCCIATMWLAIPLPASGFFNTGDVFVLLAGWCLGPLYGSLAAAVGSALADVVLGFSVYAPATFIIKGMDALVAYLLWSALKKVLKKERLDLLVRALSAVSAELCMALGYFLFESLLAGSFAAAIPNVVGNLLQGGCCCVLAVLLCASLYHVKRLKTIFPCLYKE